MRARTLNCASSQRTRARKAVRVPPTRNLSRQAAWKNVTMIVEEEDKREWKENRSCRLRSARLSVVDYEVAISQCARAWFIVDLFLEISANFAIGSRLARERRRDGEEAGEGKADVGAAIGKCAKYAEPWTNCLYTFRQMSQSCDSLFLFTSSSITNISSASACSPPFVPSVDTRYVNEIRFRPRALTSRDYQSDEFRVGSRWETLTNWTERNVSIDSTDGITRLRRKCSCIFFSICCISK